MALKLMSMPGEQSREISHAMGQFLKASRAMRIEAWPADSFCNHPKKDWREDILSRHRVDRQKERSVF
jgi:hypothetical protein